MATIAIKESLISTDLVIDSKDAYSFVDPVLAHTSRAIYENLNSFTGQIYDYLTKHKIIFPDEEKVWKNLGPTAKRFENYLTRKKPDLVISTHPFPAMLTSHFKNKHLLKKLPHFVVVTDFSANPYWAVSRADFFIVASNKAADDLMDEGVSSDKIKVLGIPLRKSFSKPQKKSFLLKKYGIPKNLPVVLTFSGSLRMGFYCEVAKKLKQVLKKFNDKSGFHLIILTGSNIKLTKETSREIASKNLKNIQVIGLTDKMDELLNLTDLLLAKPGGLICAEAIRMKTPILLTGPYFVEGKTNTDFLVKNGVAVRLKSNQNTYTKIKRMLGNKKLLAKMRLNAIKLAKPNATQDLANLIRKIVLG